MHYVPRPGHDDLDRLTIITDDGPIEFPRAWYDPDTETVRVTKRRYETHPETPPMDPVGDHLVASIDGDVICAGSITHADFEVHYGLTYIDLEVGDASPTPE